MNAGAAPFRVEVVAHAAALSDLRRVRDEVFIAEQGVPAELERDAARDPSCVHVLARLEDGTPIGTGRLTPHRHIGRMAVRKPWRGHGVGDALLRALLDAAWLEGTQAVHLNAQVDAVEFYARHGFVPVGERFMEAGIAHQAMARTLDGPHPIRTRTLAVEATRRIVLGARRWLWIRSHALDPGLLDAPPVLDALRTFATAGRIVKGAPLVARWHKQWVHRLMKGTPLTAEEKRAAFDFLATDDYKEGLDAFLGKRSPVFKGR